MIQTIEITDEMRGTVRTVCAECSHDVILTADGLVCEFCERVKIACPTPRSMTTRKALWMANKL